jgi:hypothetical protein
MYPSSTSIRTNLPLHPALGISVYVPAERTLNRIRTVGVLTVEALGVPLWTPPGDARAHHAAQQTMYRTVAKRQMVAEWPHRWQREDCGVACVVLRTSAAQERLPLRYTGAFSRALRAVLRALLKRPTNGTQHGDVECGTSRRAEPMRLIPVQEASPLSCISSCARI